MVTFAKKFFTIPISSFMEKKFPWPSVLTQEAMICSIRIELLRGTNTLATVVENSGMTTASGGRKTRPATLEIAPSCVSIKILRTTWCTRVPMQSERNERCDSMKNTQVSVLGSDSLQSRHSPKVSHPKTETRRFHGYLSLQRSPKDKLHCLIVRQGPKQVSTQDTNT